MTAHQAVGSSAPKGIRGVSSPFTIEQARIDTVKASSLASVGPQVDRRDEVLASEKRQRRLAKRSSMFKDSVYCGERENT
jgi:hypothetical protein